MPFTVKHTFRMCILSGNIWSEKMKRIPSPDNEVGAPGNAVTVLPPGTVLKERYEVTYLTAGGMGVIYKALDRNTDLSCIIKEVITGETFQEKSFLREKEMLSKFYHPGIVNLLDYFQTNNASYLVLEYIEGLPADKYMEKNFGTHKIPVNKVIYWSIQLCEVLSYLHSMNPPVIYRDIKPENILIDKRDKVKLIDFGIARTYKEEQLKDTESVGSPGFASPEQYGKKQTDGRSDIYSLGALLHYFFTGRDPRDTDKAFVFDPVRFHNSEVPPVLEEIIKKTLEADPCKRFSSAGELKKELEKIVKDYPYEEELPEDDVTEEEKEVKRSPGYFVKTLLFILLDMVLLGLFCWYLIPPSISIPYAFQGGGPAQARLAECQSNLKNIATVLELYAGDNEGFYPPDLNCLKDKYIRKLPNCPYSKRGYSYEFSNNPHNFTLWCSFPESHAHVNMVKDEGCYPQYTPGDGIILGEEEKRKNYD